MKTEKAYFGKNYTCPNSGQTWKNLLVDGKNLSSCIQKFAISAAKQEVKDKKLAEEDFLIVKRKYLGK